MKNIGKLSLKFLLLFCTLMFAACAITDEEKTSGSYSEETDAEFIKLENSPTDINELYEKSLKQNSIKNEGIQTVIPEVKVKEISLTGSTALKRELNQVLTYHCMKYRRRFSTDNECPEKVNRLIDICEQNFTNFSPDFVRCLKSKLKEM